MRVLALTHPAGPLLTPRRPLQASQQDLSRLMDKHRGLASDFDRIEQAQQKRKQTLEASEYEKEQAKAKARCVFACCIHIYAT